MPLRGGVSGEPDDDFALMRRIALGDRAALDLLYRRYSAAVFSLCLRITGDRGVAEDLLIDVFFELWRKSDRYDASRGAPITYIMTLARSRAIDRRRAKAGRVQAMGGLDSDEALERAGVVGGSQALVSGSGGGASGGGAGPAPPPEETASLVERAGKVREALARLEEEYRKTLELSYFEGLSHSEIATKLGKPLGTVKTHIRMGIIRMRELLRIEP